MSEFIPKLKENLENYEKGNISIYDFHEKLYEIYIEMDRNLSFSAKVRKLLKNEKIFIEKYIKNINLENDKIYNVLNNLVFHENKRPQQISINIENLTNQEKYCIDKILEKIHFLKIENTNLYSWKII